jgi:hypothetical protein
MRRYPYVPSTESNSVQILIFSSSRRFSAALGGHEVHSYQ